MFVLFPQAFIYENFKTTIYPIPVTVRAIRYEETAVRAYYINYSPKILKE